MPLIGFYFVLISYIFFSKSLFPIFHIGTGKGGRVYRKERDIRKISFFITDIKFGRHKACYTIFQKVKMFKNLVSKDLKNLKCYN